MLQTFLDWINIKFQIHTKISRPNFKEREIWWSSFGQNVGDEENGKNESFSRPILVIKKFNNHLALVIPTSRQLKENPFYTQITYKKQTYSALISHIRTIDVKRLDKKITQISQNDFDLVRDRIRNFI